MEFRTAQTRIMGDIDAHRVAMQCYIEEGKRLRGLAARAAELSEAQPASEKRKLLDFVVAECRGRCGELEFVFREPFGKWRTGSDATRQLKPKLTVQRAIFPMPEVRESWICVEMVDRSC